ncbi:MAG: hypothetical protein M1829_001982 [Trizodia sp. TS-e1964]|nr:MAG: hypothetical protein M1829_001982 [Trizodia sp. TS-e1964]
MSPLVPHWHQPSHPGVIKVVKGIEAFTNRAESLVSLPAGALLARITTATPAKKSWTTVQISRTDHLELNSDLVYCNHSCNPTLVFDMAKMEIRVVDDKPLAVGDTLTFFYPSTEWKMSRPFQCFCGEENCKGLISGAGQMREVDLKGYYLNDHILGLLENRES